MKSRPSLKVEKRTGFGRKVKKLRKEGMLPATIYGKDIKSLSVQVALKDFESVFKEEGETGLIDISIDSDPSTGSGQGKSRPVLIKNVQLDPKLGLPIHADFHQVKLTEKLRTMVPVEPTGDAKAVLDKIGILEVPLSEVEVEALPTELPEKIAVGVAHLANIGDQITVGDIKAPSGVTILTEGGQILFKVGELVTKAAEELAKAEEAQAAAAAAQTAPAGGAPVQGEAPAEAVAPEAPATAPAKEEKQAGETPK